MGHAASARRRAAGCGAQPEGAQAQHRGRDGPEMRRACGEVCRCGKKSACGRAGTRCGVSHTCCACTDGSAAGMHHVVPQVCKLSMPVIIPRGLDARRAGEEPAAQLPPRRLPLAVPLRLLPVRAPVVPLVLWLQICRSYFSCALLLCTLDQQWRAFLAPRKHDCPF